MWQIHLVDWWFATVGRDGVFVFPAFVSLLLLLNSTTIIIIIITACLKKFH